MIDKLCVGLYFIGQAIIGLLAGAAMVFLSPIWLPAMFINYIVERAEGYLEERKIEERKRENATRSL